MWDEEHDRELRRNQFRAILVMTLLLIAWYFFFVPPAVQPPPPEAPVETPTADDRADAARPVGAAQSPVEGDSFLPPVASQVDPAADEVVISDSYLELVFTRVGGRLKRASVLLGEGGKDTLQLVPDAGDVPDGDAPYPLGLRFLDERLGEELNRRRFESEVDPSGKAVTFTLDVPGAFSLRKRFALGENAHVLDVAVQYENRSAAPVVVGMDVVPAYILYWGPGLVTSNEYAGYDPLTFIWRKENEGVSENVTMAPKDLRPFDAPWDATRIRAVEWLGLKSKYFLVAFRPGGDVADGWAAGEEGRLAFGLAAPRFELAPGMSQTDSYRVYLGPMELKSLSEAWPSLTTSLTFFTMFGIMDWFAKALLSLLNWFHGFIPNYGIAIVLLTVVVRTALLPLTLKSMRSMKKMQALAPELKELQEKYKDDQQELSRRMMELYRERGVNPFSGCFPLLLQMPIFFALYRMLWNAFELRGAPFLWVDDLSQPDRLFPTPFLGHLPLVGQWLEYFNLLPLLMGAALIVNMKVMPAAPVQNPQQKAMMTIMPIMFTVFCYPLAAGLNLYVLTSTLLGMGQQLLINKTGPDAATLIAETPQKPKKKRQHFYTRAQEQKRLMAKEARRSKHKVEPKRAKGDAKKG